MIKYPCLILFIDGFPHTKLHNCDFLSSLNNNSLKPGFGYSVNQQALLFSGMTPDDLGVFGEWNLDKESTNDYLMSMLAPLDNLRTVSPLVDKGIHYLLDRKLGVPCSNIPFRAIQYFTRNGAYPLTNDYSRETIMSRGGFHSISYDFSPIPHGQKDEEATSDAISSIEAGEKRIFVSLPDLDGLAHKVGTSSTLYHQGISELDNRCRHLVSGFRDQHPDGHIIVCSDHGMSEATETVNFNLVERFGHPRDDFIYFFDSVYLRAWFEEDSEDGTRLRRWLEETDTGRILSDTERQQYGLRDSIHGDLIFVLDEGYSFAPNFFGVRQQKAYHGYHPDTDDQQAIFLHDGFKETLSPTSLLDAYSAMEKNLVTQ